MSEAMLLVKSAAKFGTVQLSSGDVFFNNGEALLDKPSQIKEMEELINSGRVPHLEIVDKRNIELQAEKAKEEADRLAVLAAAIKPKVSLGMVGSDKVVGSKTVPNYTPSKE